jgi:hydrogenase-4 membrane subunit HyfE
MQIDVNHDSNMPEENHILGFMFAIICAIAGTLSTYFTHPQIILEVNFAIGDIILRAFIGALTGLFVKISGDWIIKKIHAKKKKGENQ